jgi:hypothetical protein
MPRRADFGCVFRAAADDDNIRVINGDHDATQLGAGCN